MLDIRGEAVAAVFERDIGAVLGNAEQARQQFDDGIVVRVGRQFLERRRLHLTSPPQHRGTATGATGGRGRLGDQHLLVLELVDHGEPGHLVADDAFGDVERGAPHAVFDDLGERGLAGGGPAGDDVEPVHLEPEIPALAVVAVDVDGTDLHGRIPKVV